MLLSPMGSIAAGGRDDSDLEAGLPREGDLLDAARISPPLHNNHGGLCRLVSESDILRRAARRSSEADEPPAAGRNGFWLAYLKRRRTMHTEAHELYSLAANLLALSAVLLSALAAALSILLREVAAVAATRCRRRSCSVPWWTRSTTCWQQRAAVVARAARSGAGATRATGPRPSGRPWAPGPSGTWTSRGAGPTTSPSSSCGRTWASSRPRPQGPVQDDGAIAFAFPQALGRAARAPARGRRRRPPRARRLRRRNPPRRALGSSPSMRDLWRP